MEAIAIAVAKYRPKSFFINTWYWTPNMLSEVFEKDENGIEKMDSEDKEFICIGDFNCDWLERKKKRNSKFIAVG